MDEFFRVPDERHEAPAKGIVMTHREDLEVRVDRADGVMVVSPTGVLDSSTYLRVRDELVKAGADEPDAVLADVDALEVPAPSAWSVLTSARWILGRWPGTALCASTTDPSKRHQLHRNGVGRYVPVYDSLDTALSAIRRGEHREYRRHATAKLSRDITDPARARRLVADWLVDWSRPEYVDVAKIVVTTLVENVLRHTQSAPSLRLEMHRDIVTVAVGDMSTQPAVRHEAAGGTSRLSGLGMLSSLSRAWGSTPTPDGKVVWASIGSENVL